MTTSSSSAPRAVGKSRAGGSVQCVHSDGWQQHVDTVPSHRSVPLLARGDASQASSNQLRRERGSGPRLNSGRKEQRPPAQATADRGGQSATQLERRKTLEEAKEAEEVRIILAIADEHLDQAGSLLSSVRRDQRGAGSEGSLPLALDIETNIGRLEESKKRIENAIEIYVAVQERRGEVGGENYPPPPPRSPNVTFPATVNVEHKVRSKDLKEAVITRTSRGRRSGVEDDRRDGQLWDGKLDGGSPGECDDQPSHLSTAKSPSLV